MPNSKSPDAPLERPLAETALALASTLISQPCHHARQAKLLARRLATALAGQQDLAPLLIDARFAHPGWRSPLHRRLLGVWGACGQQSKAWAEGLNLSATDQARLQLLLRQLEDATAPSNTPICPRFMERLVESRGQSLQRGLRLLAQDIAFKRALPAQGPDGALLVGRDMACTPGEVVRCEPLYELIQYRPTTAAVRARPLLIIPPPLNRFYLLDMTPTSSLVRHALDQGLQVFLISWRNPNPSHCNWGLQAYTQAAADALHSARDITRSPQATLLGVCAGGLITLLLLGWLRARGEQEQIAAASFLVTPIDTRLDSDPLLIASPEVRRALRNRVWRQGCLGPRQLAAGFAWLLPRQLIWTPLLRRYSQGEESTAHPVRAWNQDSTRLPAQLVDDLLALFERCEPGATSFELSGTRIDLQQVDTPSWHLGAATDHIVPWRNSFPGALIGGERTFVLSSGGHIQSLLNQPGLPRAWYQSAPVDGTDAQGWADLAPRQRGSWWPAWSTWITQYSGELIGAPTTLGNASYPAMYDAPGRYVHQS